jgi:hypothetical protein
MFHFCSLSRLLSRPALDDVAFWKHHSALMTLAPLLDAPFVIQIHALAAITAFAIADALPRPPHRGPGTRFHIAAIGDLGRPAVGAAAQRPGFASLSD